MGVTGYFDNAQTIGITAPLMETRQVARVPDGGVWFEPTTPISGGDGSIAFPYSSFDAAFLAVPDGGDIHCIPSGNDVWSGTISKGVTIDCPVGGGSVVIGGS